ncbi:MAG: NAD+ synthase [Paracoccaceae bacterium]|jgi:NAD+ synthase|nr:MAG: NAD+ synthase [Paracoccaceae bacterium]|tara:strand:- start:3897 stop:5549 length:1653 start_codon:yes stop_codon:yes gene_type:complete
MSDQFKITLAQLNATVGDLKGNADKVMKAWEKARDEQSNIIAFPELFITGYNPQDLILKPAFQKASTETIQKIAEACSQGPAIAVGGPFCDEKNLYNAYYILSGGKIQAVIKKHHLPNEEVFDEVRLFSSGNVDGPFQVDQMRIGSPICEDAWHSDIVETLAETGAQTLLVPNGSPYYRSKTEIRQNVMVSRVVESGLPLVYLNLVGGQDDQVFDGGSFVLNPGGELVLQMPQFEESVETCVFKKSAGSWKAEVGHKSRILEPLESDYFAMVMGLRDYCKKAGFDRVVIGLSGGVDSALVATIAADALGPQSVRAVMLPSEYTSKGSLDDAAELSTNLNCRYDYLSIEEGRLAISETLSDLFKGTKTDLTEENIQSRLRGLLLMAISNKFGEMLLTTGNKSEVSVGYSTIYGDMAGGYNPIKDLYKTRVFDICRWRNENTRPWMKASGINVIPINIIEKPPSAELRPDQKDSDSLPDYFILDGILKILVDEDGTIEDCINAGFREEDAKRIQKLLFMNEYKRYQSAPGTRLSKRAFWLDRRYPIVNQWSE